MADRSKVPQRTQSAFRGPLALILVLIPAVLGGSSEHLASGLVVCGVGALAVISPPKGTLNRLFPVFAALLGLVAVLAFLPFPALADGAWRNQAVALGIPVSSLLSPQPWKVFEAFPILLAGICWALWNFSQSWSESERKRMTRWYAIAVALIALVAIGAWAVGMEVPGWHSERHFGPFLNRNHTANFFCVAFLLAIGAAEESWHCRKRGEAVGLAAAASLLSVGTVLSYSRAGVVILFGGCIAWIAGLGMISRAKHRVAILASATVASLVIFLAVGGATAGRFLGVSDSGGGYRVQVFRDALSMALHAPVAGFGLGNFAGVFPQFQSASVLQQAVLHPENDWLQVAAELGWGAVVVLALAIAQWMRGVLPFERGTARRARLSAMIAAGAFLWHGFVDVPGHRLGLILPALLLFGLAEAPGRDGLRMPAWVFRLLGLSVMLGGVWMLRPQLTLQDVDAALDRGDSREAVEKAGALIQKEPLAWNLYFTRAAAQLRDKAFLSALLDFRRARFLAPHQVDVALYEARLWSEVHPALSLEAWRETIRRADPGARPAYFKDMISSNALRKAPGAEEKIWEIARPEPELELTLVLSGWEPLATRALEDLMSHEPQLSAAQRLRLARLRIDRLAAKGGYRQAAEWMLANYSPTEPSAPLDVPEKSLRSRLVVDPADFAAAYALYEQLVRRGDGDEALRLVQKTIQQPGCPSYFRTLAAKQYAAKGQWREAWEVLSPLQ